MKPLRDETPHRTCTKKFKDYRSYKNHIREDFHRRCGYCNDYDYLCNGIRGFHIDHFIPLSPYKEQRPAIETDYNNLVYSCPYCNIAKRNDWPSGDIDVNITENKGYIDPCLLDYDNQFERHDDGRIRPTTPVGKYMFRRLKLGLRRHQLAWTLEKLRVLLGELDVEIEKTEKNLDNPEEVIEVLKVHRELSREYLKHENLFHQEL